MRPRVLLAQPSLQPPGGGNGVAAWMLQALVPDHHVTVLSWHPVEVAPINRFFGTALHPSDFDAVLLPRAWTALVDRLPVPAALLRHSLFMRYTRRISAQYDAVIGACNETDYGRPGIQYVHHPTYLRPRPEVDYRWYHRPRVALDAYYRIADRIAGASRAGMRANLTLANSRWTAARIAAPLQVEPRVLHPPVADPAPPVPWPDRTPCFLAVGRISPEKQLERVIRIVAAVRRAFPAVTLTIVGTWDRGTRRYYHAIRRQAAAMGDWITFRHDLPRDVVRHLMASSRYGLHAMPNEHFGMAPAEMARAGMIVWVPDDGGQVEIVQDPSLTYHDEADAVARITAVLADPAREAALAAALASRTADLSPARFCEAIRAAVGEMLAGPRPSAS